MIQKSIKKNYIYNLCYQILTMIAPLITTPYISRILGANGIGEVSYTDSIASYFVLFATLGITTYGQREISYVQDNKKKRTIVFWNTKFLQFSTSLIALLCFLLFTLFQKNKILYIIFSLNIIAVFADITWLFQGMEEFGKIVFRNTVFKIINIIYIFMIIKSEHDVWLYALGICAFTLLSNLSLWFYLPQYVEKPNFKRLHPYKELPVVLSLFIPTIAIQIYTVLDKTMIGAITKNAFENGYYEQALKISRMVLAVVTALGTVMIPRIGFYFEKNDTEEVRRLMYRGYRFVWFLGIPLCFGLIMVSSNFVPWFYGNGFDKVAFLIKVLAFLILAIGINNVTGMQYLIPTKRQNIFTVTVIIGACVNFVMNFILIRFFQSIGAAIASITAETIIAVMQLIIVRKELNIFKIIKEGIHYYIAGVLMVLILFFIGQLLTPSIIHTLSLAVIGATTYFGVLCILKDEFFISNVKKILQKLK